MSQETNKNVKLVQGQIKTLQSEITQQIASNYKKVKADIDKISQKGQGNIVNMKTASNNNHEVVLHGSIANSN